MVAATRWYLAYLRGQGRGRDDENSERMKKARLEREILETKLAEQRGELIERSRVLAVFTAEYIRLGKFLDGLPGMLAREFNFSPQIAREMRDRIDDARRSFVRGGAEFLDVPDTPADDAADGAAEVA